MKKAQRVPPCALMAMVLSSLVLSGCVVATAQPAYVRHEPVLVAPPPPSVEVIGVAPYPGYVWIGGYWTWREHRHHWVPGRWERHGREWRERPGHWVRDDDRRDRRGRADRR